MNIENLNMSFGFQTIFNDVNVLINDFDKVGVVGVNGAGKSTFFKIILKEITPDSGNIKIKDNFILGYLPQVITDNVYSNDISVFDYLLEGRPIKKLEEKLTKLYEDIAVEKDDKKLNKLMKEISNTQDLLDYYDYYNAEGDLLKIIDGMNIDEALLDLKLSVISGGQKSKVAFARLLYSMPNILLLDEPTNHLDIDTKDYIINYLKNYKGMVLVISHDIEFLDQITNKTLYLDKNTHKMEMFPGNYSKYLKIKDERNISLERLLKKQEAEEEKLKRIIAKYIGGNEKKANIAKDRQKKLAKLQEEKVSLEKKNKYTRFKININYPSYLVPIKCNKLTFGYDELLYKNLSFELSRGEKFLIVGENGVGKTTLLKLIMGYLKPQDGEIIINDKTNIGYYAQEHDLLDLDKNLLDNFSDSGMSEFELRSFLGSFLFSGDDIFKKIGILSPGERSRVALAKIALSGANTLILDEPTNHLDPMTQVIIADTFKDYEGTMLVVSHNLEFVDNLGITRMLLLPSGKIMYYDPDIVAHYEEINNKNNN